MFSVSGTSIELSRGDTGAMRIHATATRKDTGEAFTFGARDRAVFSIKSGSSLVRQKAYPMINNAFVVIFTNQDTEALAPGNGYTWDVRYLINPYYIDEAPGLGPGETWVDYSQLTFPIAAGQKCMHEDICYYANQNISTAETWTAAHWTEFWPDYDDLTFPVAAGDRCMHGGTYYTAKQAITTSEEWTSSHWAYADYRTPVDGDQVITPNNPMQMNLLTVVGDI